MRTSHVGAFLFLSSRPLAVPAVASEHSNGLGGAFVPDCTAGTFTDERHVHQRPKNLVVYRRSRNLFKTTALLCLSSRVAKTRVTVPPTVFSRSRSSGAFTFSSSLQYRLSNRSHLAGSCPNHFRRTGLGATSFSQRSSFARALVIPLGQSRSTRTLVPSAGEAVS
jgi:hypothetical protein